jgi:hypothetical protein
MDDLRVPKRRVAAEALLPPGPARRLTLFLAEGAAGHAGPERPGDLLNGGDHFVPALDEETGVISFLNRAAVEAIRIPGPPSDRDAEELSLATELEVEVTLRGGASLVGIVSYQRPPDRARLVDVLNEPEPFFRLVEDRAVTFVNKRHVVRIVLRQS